MGFIEIRADEMLRQLEGFGHFLREHGFRCGPAEGITAIHALMEVSLTDRDQVMTGLRSMYARTASEWVAFPSLFRIYFEGSREKQNLPEKVIEDEAADRTGRMNRPVPASSRLQGAILPGFHPNQGERYSIHMLDAEERRELYSLTKKAVEQMVRPKSRRFEGGLRPFFDYRKTLRKALSRGGEPFDLYRRRYRPARPRVVVAMDISGSMKTYADFYFTLSRAFMHCGARVEVFVFSTDLRRATSLLSAKMTGRIDPEDLFDLKGGTQIGRSLNRLVEQYGSLLRPPAYLMILSDGFDTGRPHLLKKAMESLASRSVTIIWGNPLLGEKGYLPEAIGMKTALPYLDHFVDIHDVGSWKKLIESRLFSNG